MSNPADTRNGLRAGSTVTLKGTVDAPMMKLRRFGQYGDDCECVWFNRHADTLGNVSYLGQAMWLSPSILERVEDEKTS